MQLRSVNCPRRHFQPLAIEDTICFRLTFDHHAIHLQTCPECTLLYLISMQYTALDYFYTEEPTHDMREAAGDKGIGKSNRTLHNKFWAEKENWTDSPFTTRDTMWLCFSFEMGLVRITV